MIYDIHSEQFAVYLFTGRKEPSMDQVCAALDVIREEYPKLDAEDVSFNNQPANMCPVIFLSAIHAPNPMLYADGRVSPA